MQSKTNENCDCLFCKWIRSKKPVDKFGSVAAFNDGYPVTNSHLLIVPLRHTSDWFTMNEEEVRDSETLIRKLYTKIKQHDPAVTGFNIGMNIGESAGQTIFHAHIHFIPRRDRDYDNPKGGVRGVIPGMRAY